MNELQKKLGDRGLVIVGVTNEAEGTVNKYVADKKLTHPLVILQGDAVDKAYGVKGFPHSWLVGADGKVLWEGHPGNLSEGSIEEALAKAVFIPPVPAQFKDASAALAKKEYGKAHAALEKELAKGANEALQRAHDGIEKVAAERVAQADEQAKAGEYADAAANLDEVARCWKGMPVADEAAAKAKEWRADKSIKSQIAAGEDLKKAEALEKTGDPAAKKKAYSIYADVAKKQKGTPLGDRAQASADRLKGG
jgi:hypothetical protein